MNFQQMNELSLFLIFQKKGNITTEIVEQATLELKKRDLSLERYRDLENEALKLEELVVDSIVLNKVEDAKNKLVQNGIEESVAELHVRRDYRSYEIPKIASIWLLVIVIGQVVQLFIILSSGMPVFSNPDFYIRIFLLVLVWFIYEQRRWALITFIVLTSLVAIVGFLGNSVEVMWPGLFHSIAGFLLLMTEVKGRFYGK